MMKMKYIKPFIEVLMLDIESILLQNSGPQSGDADDLHLISLMRKV